jgi:hypothetical protein
LDILPITTASTGDSTQVHQAACKYLWEYVLPDAAGNTGIKTHLQKGFAITLGGGGITSVRRLKVSLRLLLGSSATYSKLNCSAAKSSKGKHIRTYVLNRRYTEVGAYASDLT